MKNAINYTKSTLYGRDVRIDRCVEGFLMTITSGNFDEALKLYTEGILLSASAAPASYYAKRAR